MISIICLIYKSTAFAQAVYDSVMKYTPMISNGSAELLFVANDATPQVIEFLKNNKYKYIINNNKVLTDSELFASGYGTPEYISRVYKGYNAGIKACTGDIVVLINSDNMFSPNWLENMLNKLDRTKIVCSQLVERMHPRFGVFPKAKRGEFGNHPRNFNEGMFLAFAKMISANGIVAGGGYMPCMIYKDLVEKAGYYPEGNIAGSSFAHIIRYGDEKFYDKLKDIGVNHFTAMDSIVYHFKEGEKED